MANISCAKELLKEAREILLQSPTFSFDPMTRASEKLVEALSPLPDADESASNWQEFDSEREETWPKKDGQYYCAVEREYIGPDDVITRQQSEYAVYWKSFTWIVRDDQRVLAYQPLPPPYHPKEDVEIKP